MLELDGKQVINKWVTPGLNWRWGHPSGGTPPIPHGEHLLTFFHGYRPEQKLHRRYNMAALVMEAKPPFAVLQASTFPLMHGSERDPIAPDPRWCPLVVFPGGAVKIGETFHVAQGVNDCRCAVTHIPSNNLSLRVMSQPITGQTARIKLLTNLMIGGYCRLTGDIVNVSAQVARDLIGRRRAVLVADEPVPAMVEPVAEEPTKKRRKTAAA